MKEWVSNVIISVFAVSVISLVLPDGKMSKSVKHIFTLLLIPIVLQPILKINNGEFNLSNVLVEYEVAPQSEYLYYITNKKLDLYVNNCNSILKNSSIDGGVVDLNYCIDENYEINVENVIVDLRNSVINSDRAHIDIIEDIKIALAEYLDISKNLVVVYE